MYHDPALAVQAKADPRPKSAVSTGTGVVGMIGMLIWTGIALRYGMDGPYSSLVNLIACGVPMVLWAVFVDKVHRRPSTGIDWDHVRPWRETFDISMTKLAGLWITWGGIAILYGVFRFYWRGGYAFAMTCLEVAAPAVFLLSIPYVLWLDRRLVAPKDGAWAVGAWLMGLKEPIDRAAIENHLRSWAVKAFYLAFMLSIVPGNFGAFIHWNAPDFWHNPAAIAGWLITLMFTVDVAFATVGYVLTMKPLDAHIRTANPYAAAWSFALICYPPFALMGDDGPLNYFPGTHGGDGWTIWYQNHPWLLALNGALLVGLTGIYAWATVTFGFRFSNLTNRGILTNGPYAFSRHPAYLSKNLFWWFATLPFLAASGSWTDAVRNTAIMGAVSLVYYVRARTEERHLLADPDYQVYYAWSERNAPVPRFFRWLSGRGRPALSSDQNFASS